MKVSCQDAVKKKVYGWHAHRAKKWRACGWEKKNNHTTDYCQAAREKIVFCHILNTL